MSLVSVSILKEYLPEIQGSSIDADLTSLIARVEGFIARYLGFPLADSATSYTLDSSTYTLFADKPMYGLEYVLQSPLKPIISITSIHSDVNRVYGSNTLIDSSQYEIDKELGRIILKVSLPILLMLVSGQIKLLVLLVSVHQIHHRILYMLFVCIVLIYNVQRAIKETCLSLKEIVQLHYHLEQCLWKSKRY